MKDFLIKLLGGYRAVIVVIERTDRHTTADSTMTTFYPFCQRILKTRLGIVSFDKNNKVTLDDKQFRAKVEFSIQEELAKAKTEERGVKEKYQELIMAVEKKYQGESRHETALKYIRSAEKNDYGVTGVGYNNGGGYDS